MDVAWFKDASTSAVHHSIVTLRLRRTLGKTVEQFVNKISLDWCAFTEISLTLDIVALALDNIGKHLGL